jgi:glycerophosphoryl diester phosphodiesterase
VARPYVISHFGETSGGASRGSLEAYRQALAGGGRWIQVDVVAVGGGTLVSSHAVFGRRRAWEHLAPHQIEDDHGAPPTLASILAELPDALVNIEVKSRRVFDGLVAVLSEPGVLERVCVSTPFHRGMSRELRARFGDAVCLCAPLFDGGLTGFRLVPWGRVRHDVIQIWWRLLVSRWVVHRATRRGHTVQVWTVNRAARARRLCRWGVTGLITDELAVTAPVTAAVATAAAVSAAPAFADPHGSACAEGLASNSGGGS